MSRRISSWASGIAITAQALAAAYDVRLDSKRPFPAHAEHAARGRMTTEPPKRDRTDHGRSKDQPQHGPVQAIRLCESDHRDQAPRMSR